MDSKKKRDGAFLDNLGTYDPVKHELLQIHDDKIEAWIAKGAQCSDAVKKLRKMHKKTQATK